MKSLTDRIDDILPQTQCGQCGYLGCRPYAEALAAHKAPINQCPPGGSAGIARLAKLLNQPVLPLNPAHGVEKPRLLAHINEADCIGCTKCIQACPVDAIIGAAKLMHTIIAEDCTGCELCLPACPVDCIELLPMPLPQATGGKYAQQARTHFQRRQARLAREQTEHEHALAQRKQQLTNGQQNNILQALARAKAKRTKEST